MMDYPLDWSVEEVVKAHLIRVFRYYEVCAEQDSLSRSKTEVMKRVSDHLGISLKTLYNWINKLEFADKIPPKIKFNPFRVRSLLWNDETEAALASILPNLSL